MTMTECEWPKGCQSRNVQPYAYIIENDEEYGYCGAHFLEWLSNLPWRDEIEDASFIVNDKHARHYRWEWGKMQEDAIEAMITRPRCPDCHAQYDPPMSPDHWRYCTGRKS